MRWWNPQVIEALYRASCAGVKIDLIVRGVCCLRPRRAGRVGEYFRALHRRTFLEHSRVFYFENGGEPDMFCASADWMERNFFRRVEVGLPDPARATRRAHPARPGFLSAGTTARRGSCSPTRATYASAAGSERALSAQVGALAVYAAGPTVVV